ncbi:hypothetical protein HanRHA438_Chr10g0476181 [Helianthus annuus]|uniref:Uncharacterized protein n=1 Tax=Helianthus annuus TaxID=4232 RepID=A0A9K3N6A9_HELAN|nr:hypothetical protein HanXRQr2_Chr10g0463801 [Helianthus annuus]KAJ0515461.1 hypothetical protein HanHA300_Chr10g0380781 [Helianthus annuus]KAJ0698491.1 hypothetical protein HanLR1_Chr10g0380531 [Helianthus annuus]KAJ0701838.1 hypothetical protein HanOQP8_Chr10g0383721 [Helianthus annuus]KAJ0881619.1 hypothetical protein HanRHA438_Chr10g0476181 [Helianthus annuus]
MSNIIVDPLKIPKIARRFGVEVSSPSPSDLGGENEALHRERGGPQRLELLENADNGKPESERGIGPSSLLYETSKVDRSCALIMSGRLPEKLLLSKRSMVR